jgi:hypothetical protein
MFIPFGANLYIYYASLLVSLQALIAVPGQSHLTGTAVSAIFYPNLHAQVKPCPPDYGGHP